FHVLLSFWHIWGDLVEVVQANQSTWAVELIAPSQTLDVVDFVEELIWEAQWVFHTDGVTDALDKAILVALGTAAKVLVESFRCIHIFWGAHTVAEYADSGFWALLQHDVVVDELFHGAQVDLVIVFFGDNEAE